MDSLIVNSLIVDINKSHATAWRCIVNQEVMLLDSVISIADIDFELCLPEDTTTFNSPFTHLESDTTIYLCNADSINGNNLKLHFVTNDTFSSIIYNEFSDTVNADSLNHYNLPLGKYSKIMRDSASQIVYIQFINVYQYTDCYPEVVQPIYEYKDTSFYLCYDGIQNLDSTLYVYQADSSLPYVIINAYNDTLNNFTNHNYHLSFGDYTFSVFDSLNNTYKKTFIKIEFNDTCTFVPEEYTFQIKDTTFSICYLDSELLTYHYQPDTTLPYTIYTEFIDTVQTDTNHSYHLPEGNFVNVTMDKINRVQHITYIHIIGHQEEELNFIDTIQIDCEALPYQFIVNNEKVLVYGNNILLDSTNYNQYELSPASNIYRTEFRNTATCQFEKRLLSFTDVLTAPPTDPSAYVFAKYDRTEDTCAFVRLSDLSCNGTPLTFGKTIDIYDEYLQYKYTATIEQYGNSTIGFKFCPPYWNTDEDHIDDWHNLIYKASLCEYCRIDFKADSLIVFDKVTSINSIKNEWIKLYPNPTSKEVNIELLTPINEPITIVMFDVMGKEVKRIIVDSSNKNPVKCSVEHLSAGVYHIYIPQLGYAKKLIVMKEE